MLLKRIISGGQTGVDIAALKAAKYCGINTGGYMIKNYMTQDGPQPEYETEYGIKEIESTNYRERTYLNVCHSDGTLRIAEFFGSPGELCTFNAIKEYGKPKLDVLVIRNTVSKFIIATNIEPHIVARWMFDKNIVILNVAGNTEKTSPGIEWFAYKYLVRVFENYKQLYL